MMIGSADVNSDLSPIGGSEARAVQERFWLVPIPGVAMFLRVQKLTFQQGRDGR